MPILYVCARYLTHRTHLEKESKIVSETWQHRLLFKISRKYPLHELSKLYCNTDPERNILIIAKWHIVQMGTTNFVIHAS